MRFINLGLINLKKKVFQNGIFPIGIHASSASVGHVWSAITKEIACGMLTLLLVMKKY